MKVAIIINAKRAQAEILEQDFLESLAVKYQMSCDVFTPEPSKIQSLLKDLIHKPYNALLIAGGDGTVRCATQVLIDEDAKIPMAVLPLGTFNYFARELDYPNDIEALFKILKNNKTKLVDVGQVNDTIFINHSTIGFYSHIMKLKQKHRKILGKNKLFKIIFTAFNFFKVLPIYKLELQVEGQSISEETCFILVGNNYHSTDLIDFGERKTLSAGLLSVYILKCKTRWQLFKIIFSILFNKFDDPKQMIYFSTDHLLISSQSKQINVIMDGELFKLDSPLNYTIHKKKLSVVVP